MGITRNFLINRLFRFSYNPSSVSINIADINEGIVGIICRELKEAPDDRFCFVIVLKANVRFIMVIMVLSTCLFYFFKWH